MIRYMQALLRPVRTLALETMQGFSAWGGGFQLLITCHPTSF